MSSERDRSWRCSGCSFGPATFREMLEHARTHIEPIPDEAPAPPPVSPQEFREIANWIDPPGSEWSDGANGKKYAAKLRALADYLEMQAK